MNMKKKLFFLSNILLSLLCPIFPFQLTINFSANNDANIFSSLNEAFDLLVYEKNLNITITGDTSVVKPLSIKNKEIVLR